MRRREAPRSAVAAGFLVESLREPTDPSSGRWRRVPLFLDLRALRVSAQ